MAKRYIDANKIELRGIALFDENLDILVPLSDVRQAIQTTLTADVVPKAEIKKIINRFKDCIDMSQVRRSIVQLEAKYLSNETDTEKELTPEDVRNMTAEEVRANCAKIIKDMSKWH